MNLDFLDHVNEYDDNLVRLYDFDMAEAILFQESLQGFIASNATSMDLSELNFIKPRNCSLTLHIGEEDLGIITKNKVQFHCILTKAGFQAMSDLLKPFCLRETSGYQWLYDIDSQTDFLFSPGGTW